MYLYIHIYLHYSYTYTRICVCMFVYVFVLLCACVCVCVRMPARERDRERIRQRITHLGALADKDGTNSQSANKQSFWNVEHRGKGPSSFLQKGMEFKINSTKQRWLDATLQPFEFEVDNTTNPEAEDLVVS